MESYFWHRETREAIAGDACLTGAALIVIAALPLAGCAGVASALTPWRPAILNKIESVTGVPVRASQPPQAGKISWPYAGSAYHSCRPERWRRTVDKRVTLACWTSGKAVAYALAVSRLRTFWQLTSAPLRQSSDGEGIETSRLSGSFSAAVLIISICAIANRFSDAFPTTRGAGDPTAYLG